jgi:hypothetical protein
MHYFLDPADAGYHARNGDDHVDAGKRQDGNLDIIKIDSK